MGGQVAGNVTGGVEAVAAALLNAWRTRTLVDANQFASALRDADDAFEVQRRVLAGLGESSGVAKHWKSGGASRDTPLTHAPLPVAGVRRSPAALANAGLASRLWIEAEIALRLGASIDPGRASSITHEEAFGCIDAMCVSVELVASRWTQGMDAPPLLKLADLQSHEGLVLGDFVPFERRDWAAQPCRVEVDGAVRFSGVGTHALADPAWVVPGWLRHATGNGASVPAGTVVTTGTWCGVVPVKPGDKLRVVFDGVGEVAIAF